MTAAVPVAAFKAHPDTAKAVQPKSELANAAGFEDKTAYAQCIFVYTPGQLPHRIL